MQWSQLKFMIPIYNFILICKTKLGDKLKKSRVKLKRAGKNTNLTLKMTKKQEISLNYL